VSANRSTHDSDEPRDNQDDRQSQWAKAGLAGKLQASASRAPDSASTDAVQNMAQLAVEFGLSFREIDDLWRAIEDDGDGEDDATLDDWGGDE